MQIGCAAKRSFARQAARRRASERILMTMRSLRPVSSLFQSFFMGGFECATHRRPHTGQIDVLQRTAHDVRAAADYRLLAQAGIRTVRDGLRWHLIERSPGVYDWSSFLPMLQAAEDTGTQVIWDLCHWGVPDGLDPFSGEFVHRFRDFATAAARILRDNSDATPILCPINEISFWSWVGGDRGVFFPYGEGRGNALKRRIAEASIAGVRAVRSVLPEARFVHCEPIIHISGEHGKAESAAAAAMHNAGQFEAWDMIAGRMAPELGGSEDCLDMLGCNYYWNNQWVHMREHTPPGHPKHRPLHRLLGQVYARYGRPMILSETGAEAEAAPGWLAMISAEVRQARRSGVDLQGICLYPVMDYPGWDDGRHCICGLIDVDEAWQERRLRSDLVEEVRLQRELLEANHGTLPPIDAYQSEAVSTV